MLFDKDSFPSGDDSILRRKLLCGMGAAIGAAVLAPSVVRAQSNPQGPVAPPSTITNPPRDFSANGAPTTYFTDPDVLTIDPSFDGLRQPNAPIQRLWTGALWSEGPAWNSVGRYLVWSDIPNNRQMRWLEDDGRVSVMRSPSTTRTAIPSTSRGRNCPASTWADVWCATSWTVRPRSSPRCTTASA